MTYYTKEQEFMATLGKTINTLRKANGFTQEEFASMLGISPQAVSKWENDLSCPDIMLLPKIAEIFDITVDSLLSGDISDKVKAVTVKEENTKKESSKQEDGKNTLKIKKLRIAITNGDKTTNIAVPIGVAGLGMRLGKTLGIIKDDQANEVENSVNKGIHGEIFSLDGEKGEHISISLE